MEAEHQNRLESQCPCCGALVYFDEDNHRVIHACDCSVGQEEE